MQPAHERSDARIERPSLLTMPRHPPKISRKSDTSMPSKKPNTGEARMSLTLAAVTPGTNCARTIVANPTSSVMTIRMV